MERMIQLTPNQIKKIRDDGFCYVQASPMHFIRITDKDLYIKKEDVEELEKKINGQGAI